MKKVALLILILNLGFVAWGQEWTEPVLISSSGDNYCRFPDMIIDTNGIIHIVWRNKYNNFYSKIFYRNSFDNGESWNEITDISQNDSMSMSDPKIACNDTSNIFVSYDYNSQVDVYLTEYKDGYWHSPYLVSWGVPGGGVDYLNRLVLDKENRLYVFWWNSNMKYYYKYLENELWSGLFSPYGDSAGIHFFKDFAVDEDNNLHWVGGNPSEDPMKERRTYYKYNKQNNSWDVPRYVTNYNAGGIHYKDIALDTLQYPHFAWRELDGADLKGQDYTYYKNFDGEIWSEQEIVVEDPWQQQISVDEQGRIHIVHEEKVPDDEWQLVHYQKIDNQWVGEIIDSSQCGYGSVKLLYNGNMLYLSCVKSFKPDEFYVYHIYFMRYDIVTEVNDYKLINIIPNYKLYPNPFRNQINIGFETKQHNRVWVYVMDIQGNLIKELNNSALPPGNHSFVWDGTDINNNPVANGSYLIRMVSGKYQLVKTVQLAN